MVHQSVLLALVAVTLVAVSPTSVAQDKPVSEEQKIDSLIATIESLKEARFIRNGKEYDCKAAAEHLRLKRKAAGDRVKTARDFITHLASKSSRSGEPYKIKFKDGTEQTSREFLTGKLDEIEGNGGGREDEVNLI